jgi:RND family efflux transporter MFP subunit
MGIGWIVKTGFFILLVGGAAWVLFKAGAFSADHAPPHVTPTAKATTKDIEETVLATGEVSPVNQTEIRSEVSAQVMQVQVKPGQPVVENQQLVQLDRRELESQVNEDQYQIAADELRARQAQKELDRDRELIGKGFIPQKEYDDADIAQLLAQNDLQVQRAKLETLRQQIIKTDIRAPHAGIVLKLDARPGQVIVGAGSVSSGTVLMRIADLSRLKVDARLNEVDVVKVHLNDKVELTFDSVPDITATGTIDYISPSADSGSDDNQSSQGQFGRGGGADGGMRGFETEVTMDQTDQRIRPGITAHIKITMAKAQSAITIPLLAVFTDEKKSVVYLKKGTDFDKREVDTGISDGVDVQIKKGVSAGDQVATENPEEEKAAEKAAAEEKASD